MAITVSVILGSIRPGRFGIRAAKYIENQLKALGAKVHLIDPLELDVPLFATRYDYIPESDRSAALVSLHAKFTESDAFILLTPEYNHTYSPVLSSLLNYFYHNEYYYKAAAIQMRPYLGELGLVSIPKLLAFPVIQNLLNENGSIQETSADAETLKGSSTAFLKELLWYAQATKTARAAGTP
ncbi:NADPH-dependent FMN reductase [Thraustotheca clavata]|uniref:NADPH-dependent FMN reductase n=1 Tax=Thraustotheca clavata TaxID=74557 RepID=A0A1W0AA31_9STRA|nr:NADPH-dependent FMN reductase [Thraustotheca clavata]